MIKGFSLKSKERRTVTTDASGQPAVGSTNVALIRIQKDISDIQLPPNINLSFPNPDDLLNFEVKIRPKEGFYQNGEFNFVFKIKQMYPYEPPKVQCKQKIFHPNIDLTGNVCLNILREDWKPVLSLSAVIFGLQFLFLEPNTDDPLNKEAAELLARDATMFQRTVSATMSGNPYNGEQYDRVSRHRY